MTTYHLILFKFVDMRTKPKFQYWMMEPEVEVTDWELKKRAERDDTIPKEAYTRTIKTARTFLKVEEVTPNVHLRMARYFNELSITHSEKFRVESIETFQHPMLPNFLRQTTLDRI